VERVQLLNCMLTQHRACAAAVAPRVLRGLLHVNSTQRGGLFMGCIPIGAIAGGGEVEICEQWALSRVVGGVDCLWIHHWTRRYASALAGI